MKNVLYSMMTSSSVFSLFLQVVPIALLVGIIYAVYRRVLIKKNDLTVHWGTEIIRWLFVCYLTGLINLILVPMNFWTSIWADIFLGYRYVAFSFFSGGINLVPMLFKLAAGELTIGNWVLEMLIYNFLMFVPFGFFLSFVSKKINTKNIWRIAVIVPIAVEIIQPIVGRSFDVDDLVLNFIGITVGFFLAITLKTIHKPKSA